MLGDDAVLPHLAADRNDLRDAGDGEQLRADHEVGESRALPWATPSSLVIAISMISPMIDVTGPICGVTPRGSCSRTSAEALGNELAVAIDVRAPVELDIDDGQADPGHRTHARHARHAVHDAFDREGDELLDLLRREAFGLRHQRHDRPVEVGKDVDRNARQDEAAVADQHQRRRQHEEAVAQADR